MRIGVLVGVGVSVGVAEAVGVSVGVWVMVGKAVWVGRGVRLGKCSAVGETRAASGSGVQVGGTGLDGTEVGAGVTVAAAAARVGKFDSEGNA